MAKTSCIRNAAWVAAWDESADAHMYLRDVDVVFTGNTIDFVGKGYEGAADEEIDGRGLFVMPGLVNLHCHPYNQPLFKGFREELGSKKLYMSALYDCTAVYRTDDEGRQACAEYALSELLLSGVTTVTDLSFGYPGWLDWLVRSGLRAYVAPMYCSAFWYTEDGNKVKYNWDEAAGRRAFDDAVKTIEEAEKHPSGRLSAMLLPAQIDTCTEELLRDSLDLAEEKGWPIQTHAAQSIVEFHEMTRRHGVTPVQWLHQIGFLRPKAIIGHAILIDTHSWVYWPTKDDLALLVDSGTSVAHCPVVFSRYGMIMESLGDYIRAGVNMGIGTDTHPHNMLEEMRTAAILSRVADKQTYGITTAEVFHAATAGSAKALGRDDIGRLAPGAKADIVLVDITHPAMLPVRDPLRSLIYTAAERAVRDVYVDGVKVVGDGKVLTLDQKTAGEKLEEAQKRAEKGVPALHNANLTAEQVSPLSLPVGG